MANIIDRIIAHKKKEVEGYKKELEVGKLAERVEIINEAKAVSISTHLIHSDKGIIAEFKRKSPSSGWIRQDASAREIPISFQNNGASALSIQTDSRFFGGSNFYLRNARLTGVTIPILYNNFIIDEYQLYMARLYGSNAVMLIASCLTKEQCRAFIDKAHELKMEVLLEMHTEEETEYAELLPDMCGIGNRDLANFEADTNKSFELIQRLPYESVKVSIGGLSDPNTVRQLREAGYRGFLMGEYFMKEPDPGIALQAFLYQI